MINVISLYQDTVRDDVNESENGYFAYEQFNRNLRRAEMNLQKFLTGDLVASNDYPIPYNVQKIKDYLGPFIVRKTFNNNFPLPEDYYTWDNLYKIGSFDVSACDDNSELVRVDGCNTPIPILDGQAYYSRCNSFIEGLKPSEGSPIAKIVNKTVEMMPSDIGSVALEYIRYPKFGEIKWVDDPKFNQPVADPLTSINLEWGEEAREPLIWFMVNKFSTHTSSKSAKENAMLDKPRG